MNMYKMNTYKYRLQCFRRLVHLDISNGKMQKSQQESSLTLYGDEISPAVRFVMMTASVLGIDMKIEKIDLFKAEHRSESYKKINPLGKVPTMKIGDTYIRDSHAIALYLCENFGGDSLYPRDPLTRVKVQDMMCFNVSTLFPINSFIYTSYFAKQWPVDQKKLEEWQSALDYLEHQLSENSWLAGDKVHLCDLCCAGTVSSLDQLIPPISTDRHPKVNNWMRRVQDLPYFESKGLEKLRENIPKV